MILATSEHTTRKRGLDIEVSCQSLEEQGIKREPVKHLSIADWQREQLDRDLDYELFL